MGDTGWMSPLLDSVDAVTVRVPDLDAGLAFYRDALGHRLLWRNDDVGQAGLELPGSATELVLSTRERYEPNWKVQSAADAVELFCAHGGRVVAEPVDIPVGHVAVVEDPFGNSLVLLDVANGTYVTDGSGTVTGVTVGLQKRE
jgi:catechol 2,3-dioxygenase-like lactoylglutathione lyase family enzyme